MKKHDSQKSSKYLLWPLCILLFLTIGVFLTAREVPKKQEIRSHAQVFQNPSLFAQDFSSADTDTPTPTPTKAPQGVDSTINIAFSIPGINKQANTKPLRTTRNITLNFYDTDTNTQDPEALPLFSVKSTAIYDADVNNPTYTLFVGKNINLSDVCKAGGPCIPNGNYQIALKTTQSLQKVIKLKLLGFSGKVYELNDKRTFNLSFGEMIVGDIIPSPNGDNLIDAEDISALINCLGDKATTSVCIDKQGADFNDDGVVDETDHTILTDSIQKIIDFGGTIPSPVVSPTIVKKRPTPTPTPAHVENKNNTMSSYIALGIIFILFLGGIYLLLRNKKFKAFLLKRKIARKEYFIKKKSDDDAGKGIWLTLTDDTGPQLGHYAGVEVQEGFAHIKGSMKYENGKTFIEVTEIIWEKQA